MFGIGFIEILIIAVAALVLFGPDKLPEIMAQIGRVFVHFRKITSEVKNEIDEAIRKAEDDLVLEERVKIQKLLEDANAVVNTEASAIAGEVRSISTESGHTHPTGAAFNPNRAPWERD